LADELVARVAGDVDDGPDPARVVLVAGVVEAERRVA
jgi:hypothetical protein